MKDILKNELNVFDDKETYYLKNPSGNILQVTKEIVMSRFGFIWKPAPGAAPSEREGKWKKALAKEEGFELVDEKDWQKLENERLGNEGKPAMAEKPEEIQEPPEEKPAEEPEETPEPEPESEFPAEEKINN